MYVRNLNIQICHLLFLQIMRSKSKKRTRASLNSKKSDRPLKRRKKKSQNIMLWPHSFYHPSQRVAIDYKLVKHAQDIKLIYGGFLDLTLTTKQINEKLRSFVPKGFANYKPTQRQLQDRLNSINPKKNGKFFKHVAYQRYTSAFIKVFEKDRRCMDDEQEYGLLSAIKKKYNIAERKCKIRNNRQLRKRNRLNHKYNNPWLQIEVQSSKQIDKQLGLIENDTTDSMDIDHEVFIGTQPGKKKITLKQIQGEKKIIARHKRLQQNYSKVFETKTKAQAIQRVLNIKHQADLLIAEPVRQVCHEHQKKTKKLMKIFKADIKNQLKKFQAEIRTEIRTLKTKQ